MRWWFIVSCVAVASLAVVSGRGTEWASEPTPATDTRAGRATWDHRYRIDGSVRLLLSWVGRENVGAARITRVAHGSYSAFTFLAGSDPSRAPRGMNQWGFTREEANGTGSSAFTIRSIDARESADTELRSGGRNEQAAFRASCWADDGVARQASVADFGASPDMTFRALEQMLGTAGAVPHWETVAKPSIAGVHAGFVSALQSAIDESVARWNLHRDLQAPRPRAYGYNGDLFTLLVRELEAATPGIVRGRFRYQNMATGSHGDFAVSFGTIGELRAVPVELVFFPSWWVRVRLRLDDAVDVPGDIGSDRRLSAGIRDICGRALRHEVATE